jgi:hypothetical protein
MVSLLIHWLGTLNEVEVLAGESRRPVASKLKEKTDGVTAT